MSILINDDLIWVSIPRNASHSIEKTIVNSGVNFKHYNTLFSNDEILNKNWNHGHFFKKNLHKSFGDKESFCIKRDWLNRWLSSLEHFWNTCKNNNLTTIIEFEDIDNDFIYKTFNNKFFNLLYHTPSMCTSILVKTPIEEIIEKKYENIKTSFLFLSQEQWLNGEKCTYEFDIKELDKFKTFYEKRYDVKIDIPHENASAKRPNKIILDDDLKNHLWETFEKPFLKSKKLL